jgi:hypothetical protein
MRSWASWSDNPLSNGLMVKLEFLYLSIKMLSIAVDERLLILVGKSTILYKRESN